jgi:hypothetical protein
MRFGGTDDCVSGRLDLRQATAERRAMPEDSRADPKCLLSVRIWLDDWIRTSDP